MKTHYLLLLLTFCSFLLLSSCADEEFTDLPSKELEDSDMARYNAPYFPHLCWESKILVDMNCDGIYESDYSFSASTVEECIGFITSKTYQIQQAGGCYSIDYGCRQNECLTLSL